MGFLQEFVSVLPSIASVIAPLFAANKNDYLKYTLYKGRSVYFKKEENGDICCCNPFHEPISLVFPERNGVNGESISIDASSTFPVTPLFAERAKKYIDEFRIEKGGIQTDANRLSEAQMATLSASGKVANQDGITQIGTSLSVKIDGEDLILQINPRYRLEGVLSLEISGDNNEPCCLFANEENDGSEPAPLQKEGVSPLQMRFPGVINSFSNSSSLFVSAVVRCSHGSDGVWSDEQKYYGSKMTESDWEFLKKGRCLNG